MRIYESKSPADSKDNEAGRGGGAPGTRAEIPLQPMEKTMVKQVVLQPTENHYEADNHTTACGGLHTGASGCILKKAVILWRLHTAAGSWQELWPMERSPHRSRFSGRSCDPVGDPHCSSSFLKGCTLRKGPMLENFVKDCLLWVEPHGGAEEEHKEEGVVETKHYGLTTT